VPSSTQWSSHFFWLLDPKDEGIMILHVRKNKPNNTVTHTRGEASSAALPQELKACFCIMHWNWWLYLRITAVRKVTTNGHKRNYLEAPVWWLCQQGLWIIRSLMLVLWYAASAFKSSYAIKSLRVTWAKPVNSMPRYHHVQVSVYCKWSFCSPLVSCRTP
jgi:hypothetical protein